ncbi:helix-turn-helix transcriptional regulator [Pleionea sp. CnH1-48]|uniref:helix-turn-helix transcriptional regulator n=1 Tax=Pleionea sp. CnH1-48 TaxID=2954494 RepID=UPI0020985FD0|nr:helix-turn-helix transcriptional regulator [Pleionea sp. CnH1-48]MCO7223315.1 helix-turn-helix transcriptional regulator [Pleionea sp. CnH1-48]
MKLDTQKIKAQRQERGWTQQHLADVVGVSLRTIQRIEKTGATSMETVSALVSVLELEREELLAESKPEPASKQISEPLLKAAIFALGILLGVMFTYYLMKG